MFTLVLIYYAVSATYVVVKAKDQERELEPIMAVKAPFIFAKRIHKSFSEL